jgi:hypothetical protein
MPTCQNNGDHLLVEVSEPYSIDQLLLTIHEVANHCRTDNLNKVLIDIRKMIGSPNIFDRYRMGIEIARTWGPKIKVAVITKPGFTNRVTEDTAVNRGAKLFITSNVETAVKWLEIEIYQEKTGAKHHA